MFGRLFAKSLQFQGEYTINFPPVIGEHTANQEEYLSSIGFSEIT